MITYTRVKCGGREASVSRVQNKTLTEGGFRIVEISYGGNGNFNLIWYREAHGRAIRLSFERNADITTARLVEAVTKFFCESRSNLGGPLV